MAERGSERAHACRFRFIASRVAGAQSYMVSVTAVSHNGGTGPGLWVGVVVDVAVMSEAVAGLLAAGGVKELGEAVGGGLVAGIVDRVKKVFGSDARSVDALDRTRQGEPGAVAELAAALAWYARQNQAFAQELAGWAAQAGASGGVTQQVHAGRDAYVAGRDQTVTNYRQPGE
jgi:hypothetical protein